MPPPTSSKRKRPLPSLLQPGSWRNKRSRSNSPSGSAPDSSASSQGMARPHTAGQSATHSRISSPDAGFEPLAAYAHIPVDATSASQGIARDSLITTSGSALNQHTNETPWTGLEKALAALHITTKICPPLHSAIDGLRSCLHIFEAVKPRKDYDELATGLTAMVKLLIKHMSVAPSRDIVETITDIAGNIRKEVESIDKRQSRSGPHRMLGVSGDEEDLVRRYRRIEQLFRQLQAEASMSAWSETKKNRVDSQLEKLGPVKLASYNSMLSMDIGRRSCTKNTRTQVLNNCMVWAGDPRGAKIYWMNGMAGTGKTTIAYSFSEELEAAGQLAASFFCTRTSRECSEAKQIVPTLAYQLARRSAPFRDALCGVLNKDPDVGSLNAVLQFGSLLAKPLVEARESMARNLVVVVDALDECSDPHAVTIVLDILFRFAADLPVKFFVTSRPEPSIRNSMMSGISERDRPDSILYLHEVEESLVQADIERYLKDELDHMLPAHATEIEQLAEQAGKLFIYAATAIRYIQPAGKFADPKQRLKTILGVTRKSKKSLSDLDALYSAILSASMHDDALEPEEQDGMRTLPSVVSMQI
ncbi:unnamed protein product [Rhizoctonia solani]|uniref:Nephrocystin 3-like N-terminal domain-containing protein n=1 Tax=Rhizoctonia solani TaxID=456999 RepID=A0A8H3HMD1_9AGAM|nr:unnamed protein product [Rhizoctonia solani]